MDARIQNLHYLYSLGDRGKPDNSSLWLSRYCTYHTAKPFLRNRYYYLFCDSKFYIYDINQSER